MTRLRARVARAARRRRGGRTEVWHQDTQGADFFTSTAHPGEVLTFAQLEARPQDDDVTRITVLRVEGAALTR